MLRRNTRALIGCAVVLIVGIVVGIALGSRDHARRPSTREIVTVGTTVTVVPGGGSSSP